jgi:hypothetical protein
MPRYFDYLNLGWKIVIVGDVKSDVALWENFTHEDICFLSYEQQEILYPDLSRVIGSSTYARKNLGYLYAIENGAECIFDTDDDTFLRFPESNPFHLFQESGKFRAETDSVFFNPYNHFAAGQGLWPRGYPLTRIESDRWSCSEDTNVVPVPNDIGNIDIVQTLVNLEPDVDAIYRLVINSHPMDFAFKNDLIKMGLNTFSPGNTQSTFWLNSKRFDFLYIPKFIDFRFCDILKLYIAQSQLDLAYAGFITEQFRNPHNFMDDFKSEVSCYLNVEKLVGVLLDMSNGTQITEIYKELISVGICEPSELIILQEFLKVLPNE